MTSTNDLPVIETPWEAAWQPELVGTLVLLLDHKPDQKRLLLIEKLTGHGKGKINAPGGKWEVGESLRDCAKREIREETGLAVDAVNCATELRFVEQAGAQWLGYVFVAHSHSGTMEDTAEANPFWCALDAIPYAKMWDGDKIWMPDVLDLNGFCDASSNAATSAPLIYDFLFHDTQLLQYQENTSRVLSLSVDTQRQDTGSQSDARSNG